MSDEKLAVTRHTGNLKRFNAVHGIEGRVCVRRYPEAVLALLDTRITFRHDGAPIQPLCLMFGSLNTAWLAWW